MKITVNKTIFLQRDARYLVSNSKDQTVKLWDVRVFSSRETIEVSGRI